MTRTILYTATLATAVGLFALGANAQEQTQTQTRLSVGEIAAMLEEQGYAIREIELERGRYDVEMIDANGMRVEAYLDAATGAVLPYRDEDDEVRTGRYDDDDDDGHERDDDDRGDRDDS